MSDIERRPAKKRVTQVPGELAQGRRFCEERAWADAFQSLSRSDEQAPLGVEDLELLAMLRQNLIRSGVPEREFAPEPDPWPAD